MNLKDFSLLKEDSDNYTIGHPKGKSMTIPKSGLSTKAQELVSKLKKAQNFADGGDVDLDKVLDPNAPQSESNNAEQDISTPTPAPTMSASDEQNANIAQSDSPAAPAPQQTQAVPSQPTNAPAPQGASPDLNQDIEGAIGSEKAGTAAEQKVGKQQQQILGQYANQVQDLSTPEDKFKEYQAKDQQLESAVASGKIDPDRYWNNKSTGSKIVTALGVLIGGLGGGPNLALENLKNSVTQDIDAQKNDQSKNMNLWKMNREQLGSDQAATLATENQYNVIAQAKLKAAASGALGPQAAANAAPGLLALQQQQVQNNRYLGLMQWAKQPGMTNQNPAQLVNTLVPKEQQAKALEEVGNAQQGVQLKKDVIQSYNDLNNKALGGALSPSDRASAINAYGGILAKLSEGRFNLEESKQQMDALLPSKFESAETRQNKMARINNFFQGLVKTPTLDANFIPVAKFGSTNLNSVSSSYLPGSVVSVKGKQYKVASDGDSLTPI